MENVKSKFSLYQIYAYLYYKLKDRDFDFNEISNYIGLDRSVPSRLTNHGYAISSFSDVVDFRRKRYRLISPEDEAFASGFLTELKYTLKVNEFKDISINKLYFLVLQKLRNKLNYLISGIHAFNYYVPTIIGKTYELMIFKGDLDKFYSIFAKLHLIPLVMIENSIINQIKSNKYSNRINVILNCSLTLNHYNSAHLREELPIISPEYLILDFLISEIDLYYVLALLLTQDIDFPLLINLAHQKGVVGKLLFLIQALEKALNRNYLFHENINEMKPNSFVSFIDFPEKSEFEKESSLNNLITAQTQAIKNDNSYFSELGKEWGINSHLKKSQLNKVIEDINKESWSKFWE